jgi:hypothetical protein
VEEYEYSEALVQSPEELPDAVSRLLEPSKLDRDRARLADAAGPVRDRAAAMWNRVFETIDRGRAGR